MNSEYLKVLPALKEHYNNGGNVQAFLRNHFGRINNTFDDILCSYDLQAGSYVKFAKENQEFMDRYSTQLAGVINGLGGSINSILEAGVGAATTFANTLLKLNTPVKDAFGLDISWSILHHGRKYLAEKNLEHVQLGTGNMFSLPFQDNSIDVIYTSHAIDPNGGMEGPLLDELYRVTAKYLVLFEPGYDFADEEGKRRMERNGHSIRLWDVIQEKGYKVLEHRKAEVLSNPLNPTTITIIEKVHTGETPVTQTGWACPVTRKPLAKQDGVMFSEELGISYPVIKDIPCLLPENVVLTIRFND